MSDTKKIVFLFMMGILFTACTTVDIPKAYNFKARESETNPYGCWTIFTVSKTENLQTRNHLQGELIFMNSDSTILLESDNRILCIHNENILQAQLITHKNQAATYAITTTLFLVPNIIGAIAVNSGFLALGVPVALVGYIHAVIEGVSERNILKYPQKDKLENFTIFSRFPAGLPQNVDINQLSLKKSVR